MRRTKLRKIGKVGQANIKARKRIAEIAEEKGLNYCEIRLEGCLGGMYLAPAHRHPRSFYSGSAELLSDYRQWIVACQSCHSILDGRSKMTQEESDAIFDRLRGVAN